MYTCEEPQQPSEKNIDDFQENLHPGFLYDQEVLSGPTTPYLIVKDYFVLNSTTIEPHSSISGTSHGLMHMLYGDEANCSLPRTVMQGTTGQADVFPLSS